MPVTDPIHDQRSSPAPTPGGLLAPPFIFDKYSATVMVCSCADSVALPFALCPLPHLPHDVRPGYDADELSFFIHDGHAFDPSLTLRTGWGSPSRRRRRSLRRCSALMPVRKRMSASDTTPRTRLLSSTTGMPLILFSDRRRAAS